MHCYCALPGFYVLITFHYLYLIKHNAILFLTIIFYPGLGDSSVEYTPAYQVPGPKFDPQPKKKKKFFYRCVNVFCFLFFVLIYLPIRCHCSGTGSRSSILRPAVLAPPPGWVPWDCSWDWVWWHAAVIPALRRL